MLTPPWFEVPPAGYGGIENVVAGLVDQLVARGHHVTLLSAGRDLTDAQRHVPVFAETAQEPVGTGLVETGYAARAEAILRDLELDIIHDHTLAGVLSAPGRRVPTVHTVHNPVRGRFGDYLRALGSTIDPVAISRAQITAAPDLPWAGCVLNGLDLSRFPYQPAKSDYVLFLGRILPEKGTHLAIDAAAEARVRIVVAGPCEDPREQTYFDAEIRPRLGRYAEWFGPADFAAKTKLLSSARAVLCPFQWEEPFGLVVAEAMACGTPVIATPRGAAPELIRNNVTGFLTPPGGMAQAIQQAATIEPLACRTHAETTFGLDEMARCYERIYRNCIACRGRG
ncbi:glycosyltransferase family 4 protein [Nocardioides speluncae]|uniref:glycosyltransferase family 4 protein n=1 Tax=Nocardioides speluncae TaxID=2670337 RepID=UPI000D6956BC|nr:glycosyltransferase family 4 protein [Nocardioides speluncae]